MAKNCLVFITVLVGQSEGLPNITGEFSFSTVDQGRTSTHSFSSSFSKETEYGFAGGNLFNDNGMGRLSYSFTASKGETKTDGTVKNDSEHKVYGSSDHVTPCNATVKVWRRTS